MTDWKIKPIVRGQLRSDKSILLHFGGMGEQLWFPSTVYYLTDGERHVLIDSGYGDPEELAESQSLFDFDPNRPLAELLADEAVPPGEFDTVIHSHLHWDHAGNADLFDDEETRMLVGREAARYAYAPLEIHGRAFLSPTAGYEPSWAETRFSFIEGDAVIAPGLEAIHTPGHTPGHLSFLVENGGTTYGLAIDVFPLYENFEGGLHPPGCMNVFDWWASANRLLDEADVVVPSHDPDGPGTEWIT